MDEINATFELFGGLFVCFSIRTLYLDKVVKGISWFHAVFFLSWGYWNLLYYPSLDQWYSFWGGVVLTIANTIWFSMMVYYNRRIGHATQG